VKDVRAHARGEERDLDRPLADRPALADELVNPRLGEGRVAGLVHVDAVVVAGRLTVEAQDGPSGISIPRVLACQI
jgi:hypothetical protein